MATSTWRLRATTSTGLAVLSPPPAFTTTPPPTQGLPARCVLVAAQGREVDLHPLVFDFAGDGWQQLAADAPTPPACGAGWGRYPAEHLRASGIIGGRTVRCLSAELQMRFHQGYAWSASDRHDVALLERECGVAVPTTDA